MPKEKENMFSWKSFALGRELSVAGSFIYNGLKVLDDMKTFDNEDEIFEFFYQISVGLERLLKVAIVLTDHDPANGAQEKYEKSLKTHDHKKLIERLRKYHPVELLPAQTDFINILARFYYDMRYDRFSLSCLTDYAKERQALTEFLTQHNGTKFNLIMGSLHPGNDVAIKAFIGQTLGDICLKIFDIIRIEADRKGVYTYEQRIDAKAFKIFYRKEFDFSMEERLWRELLVYLIKADTASGILKFIEDEIEPLDFDPALAADYMAALRNDLLKMEIADEYASLVEDLDNKEERIKLLYLLGNSGITWPDEESMDEFLPFTVDAD